MPFNTFGVATAVTPSVIETYFSHYLNRRPLKQKPTAHISYHEGLKLIRQFLDYSSKHTVEELQSFTAQWVPAPTWVRTQDVEVPPQFLVRAANLLGKQLGSNGLQKVGGDKWWQWRRPDDGALHAEWIEMKKDYNERRRAGLKCDRCILYVHGGAYYFGSVDEHRYQMQRHARKLKARVLAPRYRLAPQFPFPCGLQDCIATYFYLLEHFDPAQVLLAGDSAGGGMVVSMLVTLRDQGCPLPAGVILLSPWVDLTHSFPSTSGDGLGDYIPPHGFHHKPSMAWPPPAQIEVKARKLERKFTQPVEQAFDVVELPATTKSGAVNVKPSSDDLRAEALEHAQNPPPTNLNQLPGLGHRLELEIDNKLVRVQEQIQLYAKNELLTHPLVSPVQQPSLGGLPPILIQVGGGELLRDEQIYIAHKAANPKAYPPSAAVLNEYDPERIIINQYPPTDVQLQVWEDLCHVPHTLSFTRPAKYMYRSVAQFGAFALARAQNKSIEILEDDAVSIISDGSDHEDVVPDKDRSGAQRSSEYGSIGIDGVTSTQLKLTSTGAVGKAGDELPPFKDHMIRQRVNRHGMVFPLPHRSEIASLHVDPATIGTIKPGPVRKWLAKRAEHEQKFAGEYKKLVKKRAKEAKDGYDPPEDGEFPPPTALVNRRRQGVAPEAKKKGKSWGLAMWSGWGSSHDESTIQREEKVLADKAEEAGATERFGSLAAAAVPKDDAGSTRQTTSNMVLPAAALSSLTIPKQQDQFADASGKQRSPSAPVFVSPGSNTGAGNSRPRSPHQIVKDAGQVSSDVNSLASPVLGSDDDIDDPQQPGNDSQRSSSASGNLQSMSRPTSVAAANPSQNFTRPNAQAPTFPAVAPTIADLGRRQDAAKVPGAENTFLNPESSRPHNGIVAYPFKLRTNDGRGSSNLSTLTLDSNEPSDRESAIPENGHKIVVRSQESTGQAQDVELQESPISAVADNTSFGPFKFQEEGAISPLDTATPTAASASTASSFTSKQGKFAFRDSRLGILGADGMPTSAWGSHERSVAAESLSRPAPFKIRNPVFDSRAGTGQASPSSTADQQTDVARTVPFRVRQTIYDPKIAPVGKRQPLENFPTAHGGEAGGDFGEDIDIRARKEDTEGVTSPSSNHAPTRFPAPSQAPMTAPSGESIPTRSPVDGVATHDPAQAVVPYAITSESQPAVAQLDSHGPAPPPPPKDDELITAGRTASPSISNGNGVKRKAIVPTRGTTIEESAPPTIGDLSFEKSPISPSEDPVVRGLG